MNIFESSILPFEPHGMPALRVMTTPAVQNVYDHLEATYKLICDLELDDDGVWAKETLAGSAKEGGATEVTCMNQPLREAGPSAYLVYFYTDTGLPHMKLLHKKS